MKLQVGDKLHASCSDEVFGPVLDVKDDMVQIHGSNEWTKILETNDNHDMQTKLEKIISKQIPVYLQDHNDVGTVLLDREGCTRCERLFSVLRLKGK